MSSLKTLPAPVPAAEDLLAGERLVDFPSLFRCAVDRWPHELALEDDSVQLTYLELDRRANAVAHFLMARGLERSRCVGLCLTNSAQAIIAMLGVLKAGGVFVPLDPEFPSDRLQFMVSDAGIETVLCEPRFQDRFSSVHRDQSGEGTTALNAEQRRFIDPAEIELDDRHDHDPQVEIAPNDLAYIMYTSGSTGMPKGVQIEHRALAAYCFADREIYKLRADDRTLQFATLNFDIAIEEIFPPLLVGSAVVVRPQQRADDVIELSAIIRNSNITAIHIAAAYWHQWVDLMHARGARVPESLRLVIVTGEKVSPAHYARWQTLLDHEPLWCNAYGPTETTVTATVFIPPALWSGESMPIGKPLKRYEAWILDAQDQPLEVGQTGELYIGGDALARGYLNRPEQNAKAFRELRFPDGVTRRIYKTGDLARWLSSGDIEFAGRIDHQIKIGSYRIEPQEIEHQLNAHPRVREALVSYDEVDSHKTLVAYIARGDQSTRASELAEFLSGKLPPYMIPSRYVFVAEFPKTINGKIDRKALPPPGQGEVARDAEIERPRTELQRRLAEIFAEVLQIEEIGIHDDFFSLGGSSLLVTRVIMRVQQQLDLPIPVRDFFANPTVAMIAQLLARRAGLTEDLDDHAALDAAAPKTPSPRPFFFTPRGGDQRLFAVHYPPCAEPLRHAVLICPPHGHEYVRAHRNLQQLATVLSRAGADVLRFDFSGQGNSSGGSQDAGPRQWREDIAASLQTLIELAQPAKVSVIAVRLSAMLAAATPLPGIDNLILVDPVRCGERYLAMLAGFDDYELTSRTRFTRIRRSSTTQLHGYRYTPSQLEEIRELQLANAVAGPASRTVVLTSEDYELGEGTLPLAPPWQRIACRDEVYWHRREFTNRAFASADLYKQVAKLVQSS